MQHNAAQIKEKIQRPDDWSQKDWDRYDRVKRCMNRQRVTTKQMADDLGEHYTSVNGAIWGIPGRRNKRVEKKIAEYLGVSWAELFEEESKVSA